MDTAEFYSKASGTATTDANMDDPNSHLRQRPLLTIDEVITPQAGNCTIFARYVEAGFATQVILNARLTRFYEREDWKRRLSTAADDALRLERGVERIRPSPIESETSVTEDEEDPSTVEIAARQMLAGIGENSEKAANGETNLPTVAELRARREAKIKQERLL